MKIGLLIVTALLLGTTLGVASVGVDVLRTYDSSYDLQPSGENRDPAFLQNDRLPSVEVAGELSYDFGVMEVTGTGSHSFVFQNSGDAPLTIETKSTSCKCTVSRLESRIIEPGMDANVTLQWRPDKVDENFHQRAEIATNDPYRPIVHLSIRGKVLSTLIASPSELVLRRLANSTQYEFPVFVYCYRDDDFRIENCELLDEETADFFEVRWGNRLDNEQISHDIHAQSGYAMTVTVKPGLDVGRVRQKLRITTNLPDFPSLDVPILGTIVSDISLVGTDFDRDQNVIKLGALSTNQSVRKRLFVLVKGPHRDEIELKVNAIDPADILQVQIGDRMEIKNGLVHKYPLTVEIPTGSRTTNRLGGKTAPLGGFEVVTTHPQVKAIRVYVRFAVQG